jgi:hypothetical protein
MAPSIPVLITTDHHVYQGLSGEKARIDFSAARFFVAIWMLKQTILTAPMRRVLRWHRGGGHWQQLMQMRPCV